MIEFVEGLASSFEQLEAPRESNIQTDTEVD